METIKSQITLNIIKDGAPGPKGDQGIQGPAGGVGPKGDTGPQGQKGATGTGVQATVTQYYLSTSNITPTGGSWSTEQPAWVSGKYLWTRDHITWTTGATTDTAPVLAAAINAANTVADSAKTEAAEAQAKAEKLSTYIKETGEGLEVGKHDASGSNQGNYALINALAAFEIRDSARRLLTSLGEGQVSFYDNDLLYARLTATPNVQIKDLLSDSTVSLDGVTVASDSPNGKTTACLNQYTDDTHAYTQLYSSTDDMTSSASVACFVKSDGSSFIDINASTTKNTDKHNAIFMEGDVHVTLDSDKQQKFLISGGDLVCIAGDILTTTGRFWQKGNFLLPLCEVGVKVANPNSTSIKLFNVTDLNALFGVSDVSNSNTKIFVGNSDNTKNEAHCQDATYDPRNKNWYATFDRRVTTTIAVDYCAMYFGNG